MARKLKHFVPNWPTTLAAVLLFAVYLQLPGKAEGILRPVMSLSDMRAEETPYGVTITAILDKYRACTFEALEWRRENGEAALLQVPQRPARTYEPGHGQPWGPWFVGMTAAQFARSRGIAHHRCHWLWITDTTVWDGRSSPVVD